MKAECICQRRGTEPRGTEPRGTEPRGTEPRGTEPRGTEPRWTEPIMNCIAVVRADRHDKLQTALFDLFEYANLTFVGEPKEMNPQEADNILLSVMKQPLKTSCNAAAAVHLKESAGEAINKIRGIHPPAHIIIVSSRHEIFNDLLLKTVSRENVEVEI